MGWTDAAASVAAWLAAALAAGRYRRIGRDGEAPGAATAMAVLGISASALTVTTALEWAYPGHGLGAARYVAIVTGTTGLALFIASALSDHREKIMKTTYKVLAYAIAGLVVVQAMAIAWAFTGLGAWVQGGGVLDKSVMESEAMPFPEIAGFIVHGINGGMVIPFVALLLLISSFFAKVPGGIKFAVLVFVLVGVQATLGYAHLPLAGLLHGGNALLLFGSALYAARRVNAAVAGTSAAAEPAAAAAA